MKNFNRVNGKGRKVLPSLKEKIEGMFNYSG